jgi:hypothetical protein
MAGAAARGIGGEARVRLLERVKEKLGFVGCLQGARDIEAEHVEVPEGV